MRLRPPPPLRTLPVDTDSPRTTEGCFSLASAWTTRLPTRPTTLIRPTRIGPTNRGTPRLALLLPQANPLLRPTLPLLLDSGPRSQQLLHRP